MPINSQPPGYASIRTVTPRRVLVQAGRDREVLFPVLLDGTNSYDGGQTTGYERSIRGGCFLAYDSAGGKWAPCKRTKANALGSSSTALVVDNSIHFVAGDSVVIGPNSAVSVSSINYSTHTLTLASAKTWKDNDPVTVAIYDTARGLLVDDEVWLRNYENTAAADKTAHMVVQGWVDQDKLLGDYAAILEHQDSANYLSELKFDDYALGVDTPVNPFGVLGFTRWRYITGSYTVLAADTGTLFLATAAATFTLPTKAAGLAFGFYNLTDANMAITSAGSADDIIADGDATADTVTFSTSTHKIGSAAVVCISPDLLFWLAFNVGGTTATVT